MTAEVTRRGRTGRWYPVVVEFTEHRVIMVESTSQQAAVADVKDMDALWEYWGDADKLDVLEGVIVSDGLTAQLAMPREYSQPIGPPEACPECGAVASDLNGEVNERSLAWARHLPSCASFRHHVGRAGVRGDDGRTIPGFYLKCSCGEPGLEDTWSQEALPDGLDGGHYRPASHFPGRTIYPETQEGAAAMAQAARDHVAGRPHSMNVPLGVKDDLQCSDLRRKLTAVAS